MTATIDEPATLTPAVASYFAARAHLLGTPASRRDATRLDPMLFALVYLREHLSGTETGAQISFAECHYQWYEDMLGWATPPTAPRQSRRIYVAPRACAKTTTWFLIAPLWAAAHGHSRVAVAFAHSGGQAEQHLNTFRTELAKNTLLRRDFPELCSPMLREGAAATYNSTGIIQMANGFVLAARGVDTFSQGFKVGSHRPDLLILDDVEPSEANYSAHQAGKRLSTISNAVLPLSEFARVVWAGTVTMADSLIHQAVKSVTMAVQPSEWLTEDQWQVNYHQPILRGDDGGERSLWPQKWPLAYLKQHEHTRSYALNFLNQPVPKNSMYWSTEDIRYADCPADVVTLISVDPAVTTRTNSDYTGIAVISRDINPSAEGTYRMYVRECVQVKMTPTALAIKVGQLAAAYGATSVLIETNQGGATWASVFSSVCASVGLRYTEVKNTASKELRAIWLLNAMQRGQVVLERPLAELEGQMKVFPHGLHDDMIDSVSSVVAQNPEITGKRRGTLRHQVV